MKGGAYVKRLKAFLKTKAIKTLFLQSLKKDFLKIITLF
ncbi:hypothetical protein N201_00285 [Helicobacter pylori UM066]|nr:hypothetical protein N201_00285 [Helicobacter pylori UM066]